jgi:hypothetical protein
MWTSFLLLALGAPPASLELPAAEVDPQPSLAFVDSVRGCLVEAKSANFRVINRANHVNAREVARLCEVWRGHLRTTLCGKQDEVAWTFKCEIVVHGKKSDYLAASNLKEKKVPIRRIDLVAERDGTFVALPREMTEVVLADLLGGSAPPRWASDGIAILADSEENQKLHQQELQVAFDNQLDFPVIEILRTQKVPPKDRAAVFHGQSASLASFLVHRDKPEKFAKFISLAIDHGYDQALRDIYAIDGVAELERLWSADRPGALAFHGLRLALDEAVLHSLGAK